MKTKRPMLSVRPAEVKRSPCLSFKAAAALMLCKGGTGARRRLQRKRVQG